MEGSCTKNRCSAGGIGLSPRYAGASPARPRAVCIRPTRENGRHNRCTRQWEKTLSILREGREEVGRAE
jgi:hypothetical protein